MCTVHMFNVQLCNCAPAGVFGDWPVQWNEVKGNVRFKGNVKLPLISLDNFSQLITDSVRSSVIWFITDCERAIQIYVTSSQSVSARYRYRWHRRNIIKSELRSTDNCCCWQLSCQQWKSSLVLNLVFDFCLKMLIKEWARKSFTNTPCVTKI